MPIGDKTYVDKQLLAQKTAVRMRMEQDTVSDVLDNLLNNMKDAFEKGQCVDLGADFGRFSVKFNEGYYNINSPRTPKPSRYTVVFKSANTLKKRLRSQTNIGEKE